MEFCYEEELSPTDTSEDSIEISVKPIHKKFSKNKRKSAEPKRVRLDSAPMNKARMVVDCNKNESVVKRKSSLSSEFSHLAPKKRFKMDAMLDLEREEQEREEERKKQSRLQQSNQPSTSPFRPWTAAEAFSMSAADSSFTTSASVSPVSSPSPVQTSPSLPFPGLLPAGFQLNLSSPTALLLSYAALRAAQVPSLPGCSTPSTPSSSSLSADPSNCDQDEPLSLVMTKPCDKPEVFHDTSDADTEKTSSPSPKKQTNYKSKTRDRRVEANARERKRVHTITAAFDTLQAAIPDEQDNGVKLSKLSVIKIATAYIMALSRMAGHDYTEDQSAPSLESVIDDYRNTVIEETKVKTRKS